MSISLTDLHTIVTDVIVLRMSISYHSVCLISYYDWDRFHFSGGWDHL